MPAAEPTSDAKWCLSSLFQHMEINLKNRVNAKTGRSTSLELNQLSNLMSHAGLAHVSKPRAPLSPTRLKRLEGAITLTTDQRTAMREVFIYYCGWAEKHNYMYMSSSQFLRFCRDTFLMAGDLDAVALTLLFEKVQLESPEQAPGCRITMVDWIQALMLIALQQMVGLPPQEAWDKLVNDHVLMFGGKVDCSQDRLAPVMLQADVVEALGQAKHKLKPVFKYYSHEQSIASPQARLRRPLPSVATTITSLSRPLSPTHIMDLLPAALVPAPFNSGSQQHTHSRNSAAQAPDPFLNFSHSGAAQQGTGFSHSGTTQQGDGGGNGGGFSHSGVAAQQGGGFSHSGGAMLQGVFSGVAGAQGVLDSAAKRLQGISQPPPSTAASHRSQSQQVQMQQARAHMPLPTFLRFLQDFDVMPKLVNKSQATLCFRSARFGPGHDQDEGADMARIDFAEFMDAVGRCALLAYNFQIKVEPEKLLTFQNGYHQGAKHLWSTQAREALQDSLAYPDEVLVPAAERSECIGGEDSPHYDEVGSRWKGVGGGGSGNPRTNDETGSRWGARSTRSRAGGIFRSAQSLANYRVKQTLTTASGHGGAEVMAMHGQADTLDNDRPMHLKAFEPSWIGKPGLPFSETSNLKRRWTDRALEMGVYTGSEVGLPPLFKQRAEDMVEARVMREQAMEALHLMYVSQRRVEQREKASATLQRRQELQYASGQRVVEQGAYERAARQAEELMGYTA